MSEDIDYSKIERWQDAVAAAHGDFTKAQEIWAVVKSKGTPQKTTSGGGSPTDTESEWISEQVELDELLSRSGVHEKKRRKYIVDMFYNTEDFGKLMDPKYLNSIMRVAKVSADKRKMVLMAWYNMDEWQVDQVMKETFKKPYTNKGGSPYGYSKPEEETSKNPADIVDAEVTKELELKRKKLEMKRAMKEMQEIEDELNSYKQEKEDQTPKKVKVPLRDRYGNIVKDADGKIVYVFIDPQEEYERQKLEPVAPTQSEQQTSQQEIMMEMMKEQQAFMMEMLKNRNGDGSGSSEQLEFMKQVLDKMEADKEQTKMTMQKLQQEIEKKKREELEERLDQLQNGLVEVYKQRNAEDTGPFGALDNIKKLKQEYPELFGKASPEDMKMQMDLTALKNSFDLMRDDHKMLTGTLDDVKDLYKQKLLNDIRLQTIKEEAELRKQGISVPSTLTPDRLANIEKKIEK